MIALHLSIGGVYAHDFNQGFSIYSNSQGVARQRVQSQITLDIEHEDFVADSTSLAFAFSQDQVNDPRIDNEYQQLNYKSNERKLNSYSLGLTQVFNKVTALSVNGNFSQDQVINGNGYGFDLSHWFYKETFRFSAGYQSTSSQAPSIEFLDQDLDLVQTPENIDSKHFKAGLRHLASPTTILDYNIGFLTTSNRPHTKYAGLAVRQYIKWLSGAMHAKLNYTDNTGAVTTQTHFGEVEAWRLELAYLHDFGKIQTKVGYRSSREYETSRVLKEKTTLGSDSALLSLNYKPTKKLKMNIAYAHYRTNTNIKANSSEIGLSVAGAISISSLVAKRTARSIRTGSSR